MLSFKTRGLKEFTDYIGSLARNVRGLVTEAITDWLIGNQSRGLKHYPPYKYVTRRAAYGRTFSSERQRRYVMAKISSGQIDPGAPHRTGRLQRGWVKQGKGVNARAVNQVAYAAHVMSTTDQARQPARVGWRKVAQVIADNMAGAIRHAEAAIRAFNNR